MPKKTTSLFAYPWMFYSWNSHDNTRESIFFERLTWSCLHAIFLKKTKGSRFFSVLFLFRNITVVVITIICHQIKSHLVFTWENLDWSFRSFRVPFLPFLLKFKNKVWWGEFPSYHFQHPKSPHDLYWKTKCYLPIWTKKSTLHHQNQEHYV